MKKKEILENELKHTKSFKISAKKNQIPVNTPHQGSEILIC